MGSHHDGGAARRTKLKKMPAMLSECIPLRQSIVVRIYTYIASQVQPKNRHDLENRKSRSVSNIVSSLSSSYKLESRHARYSAKSPVLG